MSLIPLHIIYISFLEIVLKYIYIIDHCIILNGTPSGTIDHKHVPYIGKRVVVCNKYAFIAEMSMSKEI
jgi:hypothetical protein